ncbi:hypothetical protein J3E68DRAFT_42408 [Trichoderma sp. SZMC 28012]
MHTHTQARALRFFPLALWCSYSASAAKQRGSASRPARLLYVWSSFGRPTEPEPAESPHAHLGHRVTYRCSSHHNSPTIHKHIISPDFFQVCEVCISFAMPSQQPHGRTHGHPPPRTSPNATSNLSLNLSASFGTEFVSLPCFFSLLFCSIAHHVALRPRFRSRGLTRFFNFVSHTRQPPVT